MVETDLDLESLQPTVIRFFIFFYHLLSLSDPINRFKRKTLSLFASYRQD